MITYSMLFLAFALVFAAALWWLVTTGYPEYQLDKLRERLFSIRGRLFAYAAENDLFRARAYGLTRQTLNGAIRFAHKPTVLGFVIHNMLVDRRAANHLAAAYASELRSALHEVSPAARARLLEARQEMHQEFLSYMVKSSWLFGPLSLLLVAMLDCFSAMNKMRLKFLYARTSRRHLWRLDATVNVIGAEQIAPQRARPPRRHTATA